MKIVKNFLSVMMALFTISSVAFADAIYDPWNKPTTIEAKEWIVMVVLLILLIAIVAIICGSLNAKSKGDEEGFNKKIRAIEDTVFLVSSVMIIFVFLGSYWALVYGHRPTVTDEIIAIVGLIASILNIVVSAIIRYKYKDVKNSNILLCCGSLLIMLCMFLKRIF